MFNLRAATTYAPLLHYCCCTTAAHYVISCSIYVEPLASCRGTFPLKHTHTHRVPTLVAPLASSPWNLATQALTHPLCVPTAHTLIGILKLAVCSLVPTQAFAHPLYVPTVHTLIGILKLAVCPLKHSHTHSVCPLRTLS